MDADVPREPALWIDLEANLPWLTAEPYLLGSEDLEKTLYGLAELGFRVVRAQAPEQGDLEEALLIELSERLAFSAVGAGSWAAFSDRLWDLLTAPEEPPVAVVIERFDRLVQRSLHVFVRCIHNLVSMTESVGLSDDRADLQIAYFFVGDWGRCPAAS